jgi:hydroxymethylpyrimidine pyrophosphatase-like HAD family hydrolase
MYPFDFICVDFDGTIVTHEYPKIGNLVPGAIETLKELQQAKVKIILLTMRGTIPFNNRNLLQEAVDFCAEQGLVLDAVNDNPWFSDWTNSRKVYGQKYIDDSAVGCPLIFPGGNSRPYVDWSEIRKILKME